MAVRRWPLFHNESLVRVVVYGLGQITLFLVVFAKIAKRVNYKEKENYKWSYYLF